MLAAHLAVVLGGNATLALELALAKQRHAAKQVADLSSTASSALAEDVATAADLAAKAAVEAAVEAIAHGFGAATSAAG